MWHAFNDLSVGRKLLSGFALVVILALGVAGAGFYSIFALFERGDLMTGVAESQIHLLRARVAQQDYLHGGPADSAQRAEQSLWAMQSRLSALLEAHPGFDQYPVLLEMKQAANQYQALFTQVATQHSHATDDPARLLALQDQAQKVIAIADKAYVAPGKDMAGFNLRIVSLIGTASLLLLMVASLASWLLHRQIVQPLRHAVIALGSIAQGDLRCQLDTHRRDELGQLLFSMQSMAQGLRHLVHGIGTGVDELSCVANGFAEVSRDTGAIARRQSHEAEQSVVALQQMAVSVQAVAGHTRQASEAAQDAEQQAHSGAVLVGEVVAQIDCLAVDVQSTRASMLALARESERVGNILDVIRSVAEQTNLLALNAAIEAARAGEKGRGFAVVADEVRALARRSQDATAEIATTIDALQLLTRQALAHSENCLGQADTAVTQTRLANQSLQAITASVSLIKRMNNRIANAASEQGTCAGLVSRSVVTVRDEAQASVRKALDSDAYSCDLKRLSQALSQRVRRFHC